MKNLNDDGRPDFILNLHYNLNVSFLAIPSKIVSFPMYILHGAMHS
jgi:hypothetical protein